MAISPMLPQYVLAHTRTHIPQPPFPRNAVPRATNGISAGFLKCAPFCGTRDPPQGEASDRVTWTVNTSKGNSDSRKY